MPRYAIVPDVITCNAAIGAYEKGQRHQQALHLLRARWRHAIVLNVIIYNATISAWPAAPAGRASLTSGAASCHRAQRDH